MSGKPTAMTTPTIYVEPIADDEPADDSAGSWRIHCDGHTADWTREATSADLALTIADAHGATVHDGTHLTEFTL